MNFLIDNGLMRVLTLFSLSKGIRLRREEIKEKTFLNNVSVNKALNTLVNCGFLRYQRRLYELSIDNEELNSILEYLKKDYLKLKHLALKDYFMIVDIISCILASKGRFDLYLFGSYSKLTYSDKSDIDIAIISEEVQKKEIQKITNKLEKKYKKEIEIHYFGKDFYKNKRDPLVKDIIQNGVRI